MRERERERENQLDIMGIRTNLRDKQNKKDHTHQQIG